MQLPPKWRIIEIKAKNSYSVVNSTGRTVPPGFHTIWNRTCNWIDGPTGSVKPIVFHNNVYERVPRIVEITVSGEITASIGARPSIEGVRYMIIGYLNRRVVFVSPFITVDDTGSVRATRMLLLEPDRRVEIPFRHGGDFSWYLYTPAGEFFSHFPETRTKGVKADEVTRLELCWARAKHPDGPVTASSKFQSTRVNMNPGYPIHLWRLFALPPSELPDYVDQDVVTYLRRAIIGVIWNPCSTKPRYDTNEGCSHYGLRHFGGGFNLAAWVKATYERCNCYDMAGISQLACSLLMDEGGHELVDSHWVFHYPNGYINPGPLIGWVQYGGDHLRCNTPFWEKTGTTPFVHPDDPVRTGFGNHAWVEVTMDKRTTVLDACHALRSIPPVPSVNDLTRREYLEHSLDQTRERGNAESRQSIGDQTGNCWVNPDTTLARIGIYNPWGEPVFVEALLTQADDNILRLIEQGRTANAPPPVFHTADLAASELKKALRPVADLVLVDTTITAFHRAVRVVSVFKHDTTSIVITIDVRENFEDPTKLLMSHLAGFVAVPLTSVVKTDPSGLGAYSFRTHNSAFWLRGNLFIRMNQYSNQVPSPPLDMNLAIHLDRYLSTPTQGLNEGMPSDLRSGFDLHQSSLICTIRTDEACSIPFGRSGTFEKRFAAAMSISSNTDIVICEGPPDEHGCFIFYGQGPGTTQVSITAARKGSLLPVTETFEVKVEKTHEKKSDVLELDWPSLPGAAWPGMSETVEP
ncbi:hypothetical protein F5884DRAFT_677322 [Xylogone sp. PMI_703]|nr:hypothetical protein F5884DRAFT_677322 [Xylogone sp. PMI_703]